MECDHVLIDFEDALKALRIFTINHLDASCLLLQLVVSTLSPTVFLHQHAHGS